eukprot:scaffold1552_cov144-Isochrysis_galbana.AAC.9
MPAPRLGRAPVLQDTAEGPPRDSKALRIGATECERLTAERAMSGHIGVGAPAAGGGQRCERGRRRAGEHLITRTF